jgi:hypothetical protein
VADWHGNRAIEIAVVPATGKIFRNQQSVGDIRIEYK